MGLPPRWENLKKTGINTIRPRPASSKGVAYLFTLLFHFASPMKKTSILFLLALFAFNGIIAQSLANFSKMSRHLVSLLNQHPTNRLHQSPSPSHIVRHIFQYFIFSFAFSFFICILAARFQHPIKRRSLSLLPLVGKYCYTTMSYGNCTPLKNNVKLSFSHEKSDFYSFVCLRCQR